MNTINIVNPFTATVPKLESVTDKYRFIPTSEFIRDVESLGYQLVRTAQPKRGLGMHSMTFTHPSMPKIPGMGLRLFATNSHDGTAAFRLWIGLDVEVCTNAILVAFPKLPAIRIVHVGYALDKVKQGIDEVWNRFALVFNQVSQLQSVQVTEENMARFLLAAAKLRDVEPLRIIDLQRVQHSEQAENTAWNVFNRVQESLVRGGYRTVQSSEINGALLRFSGPKARAIVNIREQVRLNTSLWNLAVETFSVAA